jgi:predicted DNA-binding transcriptional regulator AlpA
MLRVNAGGGFMTKQILRIRDLATFKGKPGLLPVSPATIWRWVAAGQFIAPFKLGPNTTVWDAEKVEKFLANRAKGEKK